MKKGGIVAVLLLVCAMGWGQKYDNTWLWGIYPQNQNDTMYPYHGNGRGTFVNDSFTSKAESYNSPFSEMNCSISDVDGNLLFYSNGLDVKDTTKHIIPNGDSLAFGPAWHQSTGGFGMRGPWCLLILPLPERDSLYKLIYNRYDALGGFASMCYSDLLMNESGMRLISKDVKFTPINPEYGGIAACKHGNGKDWWLIFMRANSNCFYKYLMTSNSFFLHSVQCIGRTMDINDECKNVFSPDGSKLQRTAYYGACDVFDFDRCTGLLSNYIPIDTFHVVDTATGNLADAVTSGEISSNNRFVYLNSGYFVLQYDLEAGDINGSKDTVGAIDYFIDTVPQNTGYYVFYLSQTAPDGKIYIGPGFGSRFFTTIDNPNGKGDSCQFKLGGTQVDKWIDLTIPYFPNYRLGRLIGGDCDTIYSDVKPIYNEKPWLKVFPNPASDEVQFDYNWIEWDKIGNYELQIADVSGKVILQQALPKYSTKQKISISRFAAGVYYVAVKRAEQTVAVSKFVKE